MQHDIIIYIYFFYNKTLQYLVALKLQAVIEVMLFPLTLLDADSQIKSKNNIKAETKKKRT